MARRKTPDKIYGESAGSFYEALPLAVAFLLGVGGGVALKLYGVNPIIAAAYAAGVLVAYASYTYYATTLRIDTETIGDNAYYLGFLFTLTSLSVTLYFVVEAAPEDRALLIPEIISGFGVALSSTIMGVFLRVFMLQLKVDTTSHERQARVELDEAVRRFRTELSISLDKVKSFSTESLQHASEREGRMRTAFDTLMAEMQDELMKSAQEFGPALRESVRAQTQVALSQVTTAVGEASIEAAQGIRKSIDEMTRVSMNLAVANTQVSSGVLASMEKLTTLANALADGAAHAAKRLDTPPQSASDARVAGPWSRDSADPVTAMMNFSEAGQNEAVLPWPTNNADGDTFRAAGTPPPLPRTFKE
jgi:ribosome-associated translation inhibitor RaiA